MRVKDYFVPKNFVEAMGRGIEGFNNLSKAYQARIAFYIWMEGTNRRRHRAEDAMSISYIDLEKSFGRGGFKRINDTLKIFDVSPNWSKTEKLTRSYKLTEHVKKVKDKHLAKVDRQLTSLITLDGKEMRTLPRAIASKDLDDVTAIAWREAKPFNRIPVDVDKMMELKGYLENILLKKAGEFFANAQMDTQISAQMDDIIYPINMLKRLIALAHTDVAGRGYIAHKYAESRAGRLYTKGNISLQTVSRLIRSAALHGLYDYDIENCHYAIFYQLADQYNFNCEAIKYYLNHKKEVRETIARDIDITVDEVKRCLLAIMFGAKLSTWGDNSIPQAIGQVKAGTLFKHPTFEAIASELSHGKKLILKGCKKRKKTLVNAMGKSISLEESINQKLAHLIQGIEAQALRASIRFYPDDIVLLMHDGFVSKKALDVPLIERTIYEATGMRLELSGGVITLPSDLDFFNL